VNPRVTIGLDLARKTSHQAAILDTGSPGGPVLRKVNSSAASLDAALQAAGGPDGCVAVLEPTGMAWLAENPNIGEWRGKGLMGALEAVQDKATKRPFPGALSVSERIANACTDQGLICRPLGQSIVLCPPFIMTEAQMDEMFGKLETALGKVFAEVA